jgi:hypothetical protein
MATTIVQPGENLSQLADRILDDPLRFTELLDLNPGLDVFGGLTQELSLEIPEASQILNYAAPVFGSVAQALNSADGFLDQVEGVIVNAVDDLPPQPQLQGYAKEALELVGELNGVVGQAQSIVKEGQEKLRQYEGQAVKLVPWLLGGKR